MSSNGHLPLETRAANAVTRFRELWQTPKVEEKKPAPPLPTREELLAEALHPWVSKAPKEFRQEIDSWVKTAHTNVRSSIHDHVDTAYLLGFEAAIEMVRDQFTAWRGQPANADPQGE